MKINYQFADPEQVQVTISATMTVAEWRIVADRLKYEPSAQFHYPYSRLHYAIIEAANSAITKAETIIDTEVEQ